MPLFGNDFLTRLEYLSLVSKKVFSGQLMSQRRAIQLGSGIEFADHRQYVAGDDFRYIDWNLFARHDELLLKRFQEEEDLHVYLLLDASASMQAGQSAAADSSSADARFDLARRVCAALAYIALANLDRVSITAFGGTTSKMYNLTRGKSRILSIMQFLEGLTADGKSSDLAATARDFVVRAPRRGLVVVISDLFDQSGFRQGLDILRHHRFETHVVQILTPDETSPKLLGDVQLLDVESNSGQTFTVTEKHLQAYAESFGRFLKDIREYCTRYEVGYTLTESTVAFDELVLQMLRVSQTQAR
ncbi:MAG: DUF58 domain-containing protein [Fuerstiella sp.]